VGEEEEERRRGQAVSPQGGGGHMTSQRLSLRNLDFIICAAGFLHE